MPEAEYELTIKTLDRPQLLRLWEHVLDGNTPGWPPGKAFEYLILRAFELENARIKWPYSVKLSNEIVEQIDGVIYIDKPALSVIVEAKDKKTEPLNIEPLAKLRNQLLRRPSTAIGAVFTTFGFTAPALTLAQFIAPQTILLWEKDHFDFCLKNQQLQEGMTKKYRHQIEYGFPNFDPST
jgi:hypothetical protein